MKTKKIKRLALFARVTPINKDFVERETLIWGKKTKEFSTTQETVDRIISGYRRLKRYKPTVANKFF